MLNLFILLLERVGLIIIIAYILMNINHFKTMMNQRINEVHNGSSSSFSGVSL